MTWYNLCFKKSVLATSRIIGRREGAVAAGRQAAIVIQARDDGILRQDDGTGGGQEYQILGLF